MRSIGLCAKHYAQDYRRKNAKPKTPRLCDVEGCESVHMARGYCSAHYQRLIRYPVLTADPTYRDRENTRLRSRAREHADDERERNATYRATSEGKLQRSRRESERRARVAGLNYETFTDDEMLALYGSDCHICREPVDLDAPRSTRYLGWERGLQREHVIPIVKGGGTTLENCRPSHGLCNLRKGVDTTPRD